MSIINITGRVGKDAKLYVKEGKNPMVFFSLGESIYQGKDQKDITIWWDVTLFGKWAENFCKHITKGREVSIVAGFFKGAQNEEYQGKTYLKHKVDVNDPKDFKLHGKIEKKEEAQESAPAAAEIDDDMPF